MSKKPGLAAFCCLFLISPYLWTADQPVAKTPTSPLILFNGRNLDNFYTYLKTSRYDDPRSVFTVVDGQIRISGEEWGRSRPGTPSAIITLSSNGSGEARPSNLASEQPGTVASWFME